MIDPIFFYIFAGLSVGMAVMVVFQTNPVTSALCLVVCLFALAALYVTLQATFVGILQILVYAGAVMVIFVFVVMLLNLRKEDLVDDFMRPSKILVVTGALVFMGGLAWLFLKTGGSAFPEVPENFGEVEGVGRLLFTEYLVPFEIISILLLVAIVGVVLLTRRDA